MVKTERVIIISRKKIIIIIFTLFFVLNITSLADEYSFERENQELPKIGDTIGKLSNKGVEYWKFKSSGQWEDRGTYFNNIYLKEFFINNKQYYILIINQTPLLSSYKVTYNYIIEKDEINKFKNIIRETKPQIVELKTKYYVYEEWKYGYYESELINDIQKEVNNNSSGLNIYFNLLPFYREDTIRFHIIFDGMNGINMDYKGMGLSDSFLSDSDELKPEIFKTKYYETKIERFQELFPIFIEGKD
ncbi:MAG: hypothetical protein ACOCRK_10965 [bacterium]